MIDKITIFTTVYDFTMESSLWRNKPINHKDGTTTNCFTLKANEVFVKYYPASDILMFTFNIPRLLYGDNIASAWAFNFELLSQRINAQLDGYIDITTGDLRNGSSCIWPHYRYWKVSYIEYAIDFVLAKPYIERYQDIIKQSAPSRRHLHDVYVEDGTIYYHSASKLHKSGVKEIIYDKGNERLNTTETNYYNAPNLTTMREWESILRLELRLKRNAIKYRNKSIHTTCVDDVVTETKVNNDPLFDTFESAVDYKRQTYIINKLIAQYGLDKPVATRETLREIVQDLTPNIKDNKRNRHYRTRLYKAIDYFNGNLASINVCDKTIRKYKKLVMNAGYHFIYSDIPLKPLTIELALNRLPQNLKENITAYKNSSIFSDYFTVVTDIPTGAYIMSTNIVTDTSSRISENVSSSHTTPEITAEKPTRKADHSQVIKMLTMYRADYI